jgi:hypothetical protein
VLEVQTLPGMATEEDLKEFREMLKKADARVRRRRNLN